MYLISTDTLKIFFQGALGAMSFGAYHQYTTNKIMELNNEKLLMQYKCSFDSMEIQHKKEMDEMEIQQKKLNDKLNNLEKSIKMKNNWW
jgi:hypothetical protein